MLADLIGRKYGGEPVATERLTVAEYLTERWLPIQKSRVRSSTYDSYRRNIELHVVPEIGHRRIDKLTPQDLDLFYATLLTEGRKQRSGDRGAGRAAKTVRNIHLMLNKAMADAARKGIVPRNVVALADAPSVKGRRQGEIKAWDAAQLRVFLDAIRSHRLHPGFHLAAHTGMRRGELLGLRWCDVDLDVGRVSVRQALVSIAYDVQVSDVKTGTGRRTIDPAFADTSAHATAMRQR